MPNKKPELTIFPPGTPSVEDLAKLVKQMTGKDPTPEEIENARAILAREPT